MADVAVVPTVRRRSQIYSTKSKPVVFLFRSGCSLSTQHDLPRASEPHRWTRGWAAYHHNQAGRFKNDSLKYSGFFLVCGSLVLLSNIYVEQGLLLPKGVILFIYFL